MVWQGGERGPGRTVTRGKVENAYSGEMFWSIFILKFRRGESMGGMGQKGLRIGDMKTPIRDPLESPSYRFTSFCISLRHDTATYLYPAVTYFIYKVK